MFTETLRSGLTGNQEEAQSLFTSKHLPFSF